MTWKRWSFFGTKITQNQAVLNPLIADFRLGVIYKKHTYLPLPTVIPRLTRFPIARIPITRFFVDVQKNSHSAVLYISIQ